MEGLLPQSLLPCIIDFSFKITRGRSFLTTKICFQQYFEWNHSESEFGDHIFVWRRLEEKLTK